MINKSELTPDGPPYNQYNISDYKLLVNALAKATWQTNADGKTQDDAPEWRDYTGQTLVQWLEEGWIGAVHPADQGDALAGWEMAMQSKQVFDFDCRLQQADGGWCWNNVKAVPVPGPEGEILRWIGACSDITGQKQAEGDLIKSETQFRLLSMLSSDTLYRMSADWSTMVNLKGFDFLADTLQTNEKWFEQYIPAADQERVSIAIDKAIKAKSLFELEHQVYRADGSVGWTFSRATPLLDSQGQIKEWFGTARDITKRKIAEERRIFLLDLSDKLRPLADSLEIQHTAAFILGERLKTDRVMYAEITDGESAYLIARSYLSSEEIVPVIGNFATAGFGQWLIDAGKAGQTVVVEDVIHDKRLMPSERDAYLRIGVRAFITTPLNKEGKWVAAMKIHQSTARNWTDLEISLVGEVAERTWAAVQRAKAEEALADSERRLRLAIDATELATWEWNLETDEVVWNAHHFRLLGMPVINSTMPSAAFFDKIHRDDQQRVASEIRRAIDENGLYDADFRVVQENDGEVRWMSGYGRVTGIANGKPFRMSGVMFDITTRKQAEQALIEADRRKDEFLALLAHELRNPMATLSNALMVLELTGGQHDKLPLDKAIGMMRREVVQLVRLVDDLLDVSRINQGKVTLALEDVDFSALVNHAVATALPLANSEHRHLAATILNKPIYVNGDPARLTQVVRNLLSNAIKFTNQDGHIWVELTQENNQAILKIRDDGIGLPGDQFDRIFELFAQVNSLRTRLRDGLGVGLTLVKDFVEKHGGRIEVYSAGLDKGSEFIIYLPAIITF